MEELLFCLDGESIIFSLIIHFLIYVVIVAIFSAIPVINALSIIFVLYHYIMCLGGEFSAKHYSHFFIAASPLIAVVILMICAIITTIIESKIRKEEMARTSERIQRYIKCFGYTHPNEAEKHFKNSLEFERSRKATYPNPVYNAEARRKANELAKSKKIEIDEETRPLEEKDYISFKVYMRLKYSEYIIDKFQKKLSNLILTFGMFLLEDICYEKMKAYKSFFTDSGKELDIKLLKSACSDIIDPLVQQGDLIKISDNLYRCTSMTDAECNIVEAQTFILSEQGDLVTISDTLYRSKRMTDAECGIIEGQTFILSEQGDMFKCQKKKSRNITFNGKTITIPLHR